MLRLLLDEPALLVEHAAAYAVLIRQDAMHWQARLVSRLVNVMLLGAGVLLALMFAGFALLLHAIGTGSRWLLWLVPLLPLAVAVIGGWRMLRESPGSPAFSRVRSQIAADMRLSGWKGKE